MYTISKQFSFSAAHQLHGLREDHPCGRVHGHNYIVEIVLKGDLLNEVGFLQDYGDLKPVQVYLDQTHDHRDLNAIYDQPSAENIARGIFDRFAIQFPLMIAVRVSETPKTWAEYRRA